MENHFVLSPTQYTRDLDIFSHGHKDYAFYIHKRTGYDFDYCLNWTREELKLGKEGGLFNPRMKILERQKNQDRQLEVRHLSYFLEDIESSRSALSPALAGYLHPSIKNSIPKEYIEDRSALRSKSKAEMFEAKRKGDKVLEEFKNNEQNAYKIKNNSISGAQASTGTVLFNKSGHPSLTSTCATATSYGNANNEKFLAGNRHYWSAEIVKANITSIVRTADYVAIEKAMVTHGIRHPSVEETLACIRHSTDQYWRNDIEMQHITTYVKCLTDIERSAFVYTGDMYHLAKLNPSVVHEFLKQLSQIEPYPLEDPDTWLGSADKDLLIHCSVLGYQFLKYTDPEDGKVKNMTIKDLKSYNYRDYQCMASIAKEAVLALDAHQDLIKGFWRPNTMPASIAAISTSMRHTAVVSDTDSSIFTVQDWVTWYSGGTGEFTPETDRVAQAVVYLSSQTIIHILAMFSAGMGVIPELIHDLNMKNEYTFPVFVNTSNSKHYFAYQSVKEGVVFNEMEVEIKGVQLKDSNVPRAVMDQFKQFLRYIMDSVIENKPLSIFDVYARVADVENQILNGARNGDPTYFKTVGINEKSSYTKPDSSNYAYYEMWQEVFAPKYGESPPPPFGTIKVNLNRTSKTAVAQWLDKIQDPQVKERLITYLERTGRITKGVTQVLLPKDIVDSYGIPEEIACGVDFRAIVLASVRPYYIALESLGIFMLNDNITRLVSDFDLAGGETPLDHM